MAYLVSFAKIIYILLTFFGYLNYLLTFSRGKTQKIHISALNHYTNPVEFDKIGFAYYCKAPEGEE